MNVQQALWHIMEKMQFNDFDFTDEFLHTIKSNPEYDGLYDIMDLKFCNKFNTQKNEHKEIKTTNPYPLVQQLIDIYNLNTTLFQYEEKIAFTTSTLNMFYEKIDETFKKQKDNSGLESPESPETLEIPETNVQILVIFMLEHVLLLSHKYITHPLIEKCIAFVNTLKVIQTRNINIIGKQIDSFKEKYPGVAIRWFKCIITTTELKNNDQDIKHIAGCTSMLFPNKQLQMYEDAIYFINLCAELQRMRLKKNYKYVDYPIEIPPYDNMTDMFEHLIQTIKLTFESDIKKNDSNYMCYLKKLFDNKSKFFSDNMLADYIVTLHNIKNHTEIYNIFKTHKKYIMHRLKLPINELTKLNLIGSIIESGYIINKNISKKEFNDILTNVKPDDHVDTGRIKYMFGKIARIITLIEQRDNAITLMGFDIVSRSKLDETCLICLEDIDDSNIETIKCKCCNKELGHINCVSKWISLLNSTCPNCRASSEQRLLKI